MSYPYEQPRKFEVVLAGQRVTVVSKPGLPDWDRISPATALLAGQVEPGSAQRLLFMGSGNAALAPVLAKQSPGLEITLIDPSFLAGEMAKLTLQANPGARAALHDGISVLPEQAGAFELVILMLPKGRRLARRWLLEAREALRAGGKLYLAGAKDLGILSAVADAEAIFGIGTVLGYKKGSRVVRFTRPFEDDSPKLPDWAAEPGVAPGSWIELDLDTPFGPVHLSSLPGVFSSTEVDPGTRLLLEHLSVPPKSRVLDLGCGYGLIGVLAARQGAGSVELVDSNRMAVAAARRNIEQLGLANARAFPSDAFSAVQDQVYDLVVTNPPFHTGKGVDVQVTRAFIQQAAQLISPGGQLLLVANQFLRYDQWMGESFGAVSQVAATSRFRVWSAVRVRSARP